MGKGKSCVQQAAELKPAERPCGKVPGHACRVLHRASSCPVTLSYAVQGQGLTGHSSQLVNSEGPAVSPRYMSRCSCRSARCVWKTQ